MGKKLIEQFNEYKKRKIQWPLTITGIIVHKYLYYYLHDLYENIFFFLIQQRWNENIDVEKEKGEFEEPQ